MLAMRNVKRWSVSAIVAALAENNFQYQLGAKECQH